MNLLEDEDDEEDEEGPADPGYDQSPDTEPAVSRIHPVHYVIVPEYLIENSFCRCHVISLHLQRVREISLKYRIV